MSVFLQTNPHNGDPWYSNQHSSAIEPTNDTRALVKRATRLLAKLWRPGHRYFKAGVILTDLSPAGMQAVMFASQNPEMSERVMAAMDAINARFGRGMVRTASTGIQQTWKTRQTLLSARYTTRLSEIVGVRSW